MMEEQKHLKIMQNPREKKKKLLLGVKSVLKNKQMSKCT